MDRTIPKVALVTILIAALAGCAARQPVYDGQVAAYSVDKLGDAPRAQYANQVPLYPGAKLEGAMGNETYGDEADSYAEGMTWHFLFKDPPEKVVAFYEAALPQVEKSTGPDGTVKWQFLPAGGKGEDYVSVVVGEKEMFISESVQGGRKVPKKA